MALAPIFRNRARTAIARQQGQGNANSPIGEGISLLGRGMQAASDRREDVNDRVTASEQRMKEAESERFRQQSAMAHARRLSEAQVALSAQIGELQREPAEGAEGHEEAVAALLQETWQELAGQLPDDAELWDQTRTQFASWAARTQMQADAFAASYRADLAGTNFETMVENHGRLIYDDPTPETLQMLAEQGAAFIAAMPVGEDARTQLRMAHSRSIAQAMATAGLDRGAFDQLEALLDTDEFGEAIGGANEISTLRGQIEAGRDVLAREAEVAANAARSQAVEALELIELQLGRGEYRDGPAGVRAAIAAAQAADVDAPTLQQFLYMADDALRAQSAQGMSVPQLQVQQADLRARVEAGTASPDDRRILDLVERELSYRDREAGGDLSELIDTGPQGVAQAVAAVSAMPTERRWAAARESGNALIAVYANLAPGAARIAIEGAVLRAERPADFLPPVTTGGDAAARRRAEALFRGIIGEAGVDDLGSRYSEYFDAALDLTAGSARRWDQETFQLAVNQLFGATHRASGGWQGGLTRLPNNGNAVVLPAQWTGDEFIGAWQRLTFPGATYPDGSAASAADVRRHFRLQRAGTVAQGNGPGITSYRLVNASGLPLQINGQDAMVRVGAQPSSGMEFANALTDRGTPSVRVSRPR